MARKKLGEILIEAGVLDDTRLRAALSEQKRWGGQLGRILIDMRLCSEEQLVHALSSQLHFPVVDLDKVRIDGSVLDVVPFELCDQHGVVPFRIEGKFLDVAMSDPTNLTIIDELRIRTRLNVRPHLAGPRSIERALILHFRGGLGGFGAVPVAPMEIIANSGKLEIQTGGTIAAQVPGAPPEPPEPPPPAGTVPVGAVTGALPDPGELERLQERLRHLEACIARDEDVLRKLMGLLIQKGICTREEIMERLK